MSAYVIAPDWTASPMMTFGPMPKPVMRPRVSPPAMRYSLRSVGGGAPPPATCVSVRTLVPATAPSVRAEMVQTRARPGPTVISSERPRRRLRLLFSDEIAWRSDVRTVIVSVVPLTGANDSTLPVVEVSAPFSLATLSLSNTMV